MGRNSIRNTLISLLVVALFSFFVGWAAYRTGQASGKISALGHTTIGEFQQPFAALPFHRRLILSAQQALRSDTGTHGQDLWVSRVVFPDVENGYYLDVGSGDGIRYSNTNVLDEIGWQGICIDPFPTGMETRTARVFKEVVDSEAGREIEFRTAGLIGGIDEYIDHTRDWKEQQEAEVVVMKTTTLDDILKRADAPPYIHYMSLDIEGAELQALKGLSFSDYTIGAFTIEHNWEEPKRSQIRELLQSEGYEFVLSRHRDDYYLHSDLIPDRVNPKRLK